MPYDELRKILAEYSPEWLMIPGVLGTVIGSQEGRPCIKVLVEARTRELEKHIPDRVEDFAVILVETGPIKAGD